VRFNNFLFPWRVVVTGRTFESSSTPSSLVAERVSAPYSSLATLVLNGRLAKNSLRNPFTTPQRGYQRPAIGDLFLYHLRTKNDRVVLATAKRRPAAARIPSSPGAGSPSLLIFECTMLIFVPPDPIIVCPKSCLYPSLHIRRTFPSISSYPLHIPSASSRSSWEDPIPNNWT
jgi:hypothetical protein